MSRITQLKPLIAALPPTPLRPAGSPQLANALTSIVGRIESKLGAQEAEAVLKDMQQSLDRVAKGEIAAQYPLSRRTLSPSHDPQYYTRIKDGVHRSAAGKGRSWWKSFFQLKGEA